MRKAGGGMNEQENTRPIYEISYLDADQFAERCADIWEHVEAGEIDIEQAAELMFGPDPYQYVEASR